ncbi:MAG: hypothetical protein HYS25_02905 [Ignavibacteriales bacterium]|nr:hypothetical protein [Ignavibacteriales bacterium]
MTTIKNVDEIIKNIFADSFCVNVICSIYEMELTSFAISDLLNLDDALIKEKLHLLLDMNLVKKVTKNSNDYFTLTNPKVCDSILMLKDAIYRTSVTANE